MNAWDNPEEMLTRAQTARAQGDTELAYQMYARASEINPQEPNAWRGRAETCANQDEALVSYAYAHALAPTDTSLERTLDASVAQRLSASSQSDAPLLVAMGQELAEVGLAAQAEQFFQRAATWDESLTDAWVWLAGLETNSDKQTEYLQRALVANPRDSRARAGLFALKPPPPAPTPTPATAPSNINSARSETLAAASQAQAESSMERLRKLRETNSPASSAPQPASQSATHAPAPAPKRADNTMRYLLLALLALVVLFAFAGIFLMLTQ
jgi:tetratricopeptide (TPR) repeat protein